MKEKAKLVSAGVKWGVFQGLVQFCSLLHLERVAAAAVCPCGRIGCASSLEADVPAFLDGEMRFSITTVCVCCFFFLQLSHLLQLQKRRLLQITSTYLQVALQLW